MISALAGFGPSLFVSASVSLFVSECLFLCLCTSEHAGIALSHTHLSPPPVSCPLLHVVCVRACVWLLGFDFRLIILVHNPNIIALKRTSIM